MDALLLALRGMWWRRGVSLTILVISCFVTAAAASGPMFLRAGGESLLQDSLHEVDVSTIGLSARVRGEQGDPVAGLRRLDRVVADARRGVPGYGAQLASLEYVGTVVDATDQTIAAGTVAFRPDFCRHVVVRAGRCATQAGETMVTAVTAAAIGTRVGAPLLIGGLDTPTGRRVLRVVGFYDPVDPHGRYWFDPVLFPSLTGQLSEGTAADALLTPEATFTGLADDVVVDRVVQVPVQPDRLRLADVDAARTGSARAMATITATLQHGTALQASARIAVSGYINWALDIAATQRDALRLPVALAIGQLLVLGWFALYMVVANATAARSGEVALAKLRGFSPGSTVAFALLETLLLLAASIPLGLLLGRLGTSLLAGAQLVPGTPVVVSGAAVAAAGATAAGGVVAAALAARRVLRRSVPDLMRRTAPPERGTAAAAAEWTAMLAAAAALVWLWAGGRLELQHGQRLSVLPLLVPGLLAVATATAAARLLPGACRAAFPTTRATPRIGTFLAVRHVARRPSGLRVVVVLTTALGLVTFAVVAWSDFARNRHDRAMAETGAARVLTVSTPPSTDLLWLVRAADPSGRRAMAVASTEVGSTGATVYGIDVDRLTTVPFWRGDFGPPRPDLASSLAADTSVSFRGTRLDADVEVQQLAVTAPVRLVAVVGTAAGQVQRLPLGDLPSRGQLAGSATAPACAATPCRLLALQVTHEGPADGDTSPIAGRLVIRGLRADGAAVATPTWATPRGQVSGSTPTWSFAGRYGEQPLVRPSTAVPARLPVIASAESHDGQTFDADGLAGTTPVAVTTRIARFPGLDRAALVGDLAAMEQQLAGADSPQLQQVWLTDGADDVVRRLRAGGVRVLSDTRAATSIRLFGRQAPSLGLLLFLVGAASAAVLAAAGTVVDLHLVGRRRAFELAAMQAVGVRRRSLHAAVLTEQALLLGTGTVLGVACGIAGARLTLPSVPVYVDQVAFPEVLFMPDALLVSVFVGAVVATVAVAVVVSSHLLVRAAVPSRLREAQA